MYRGELLFFLLVLGFFSLDFLKGRAATFLDFITLPPKITQWEIDSCTRTISIQSVSGGIPPYDFYVFKQDALDSSNWQVYRLIKDQLPQISGLPPGNYRIKAVNEGISTPNSSINILAVSFPSDPEFEVNRLTTLCSGGSPAITLQLLNEEGLYPFRWTASVLLPPDEGEVLGFSTNSTVPQLGITDTLVNSGSTVAKVEYRIQAIAGDCLLPTRFVEVLVEPLPRVAANPSEQLVCSGIPFSISLAAKSWGTSPMQVRWTSEVLSGEVTGLEEQGISSLSPLSQTLNNQETVPARVRYTFFPSFQGCEGLPESIEIEVLPEPKLATQQDLVFCPGDWVSLPVFSTNLSGVAIDYLWEVSDPSIGLENAWGRGSQIPTFLATNTGTSPKQTQITVTPILENLEKEISCLGKASSFLVTVRASIQIQEELSNYAGYGVSCAGASDGFIKLQLSGGILPGEELSYRFSWTGPGGFISSSPSLEGLQAGVYRVQISVGGNCLLEKSMELTQPETLQISQSKVDTICFQGLSGSLLVIPLGGVPPYNYAWAGPNGYRSRLPNPQNLASGTYQVTVTDANGCTLTGASQTITEPSPLSLTQSQLNSTCFQGNNGSISITATGGTAPYSFSWTGPNGFTSTKEELYTLVSGTYQVTVTDANGCTLTGAPQMITEPMALSLTQSRVNNGCFQGDTGSISITALGGTAPYRYAWTGPNGFTSTNEELSTLASGTYQVTVTDANGCAFTGVPQTITEPAQLTLTQSKLDNVCFQGNTGSISIIASGGTAPYRYSWTGPNGFTSTNEELSTLVSGTYQVIVTDANSCTLTGAPQTITEPTALSLTQSRVNNGCFQGDTGSISITTSGGTAPYTYAWTGPNGFTSTKEKLSTLISGTYQVTVTDANGCILTGAAQTITQPPALTINAQVQAESCADARDGWIKLALSGGTPPYILNWEHGGTGELATGLSAGTFRVRVNDRSGCTQVAEYRLLPTPPLRLQTTSALQTTQVPLQISALLQAHVSGGAPPYSYRWSTGQSSSQITVVQTGTYHLVVKDSEGCSQESEFDVTVPLPMNLSLQIKTVPLCEEGGQETTVHLQLSGGLAPYQINWSRGIPSSNGRVLITRESGVFDVEVKDALGLVEKRSFSIVPRLTGPLDFSYLFASQAEFQGNLVGFAVNFSPQATWPFVVISWDFGDGSSSAVSSPSHRYTKKGNYLVTLTVLDDAGCLLKTSQEIEVLDYFLEIPNVFTPNGDELNDTFFPKFRFVRNLQLQVMNKWGELIYRSQGQEDPGWDGLVSGKKAPEGVYVYTLRYQVPDGRTVTSSSTFLLAR